MNKRWICILLFFALMLGGLLGFMVDDRSYGTTAQAFQDDLDLLSETLTDVIKYGNFEIEDVALLDRRLNLPMQLLLQRCEKQSFWAIKS